MKKKKKILVICEVFFPEEFLINDLVSEWIEEGYELEILTRVPSYPYGKAYEGYRNRIYQKDRYKGVTVHRVGFVGGYRESLTKKILNYILFIVLGSVVALSVGRRFSKLFIYHTGPLTLAIPGIVAKKIYRIETSIWTQDLWPDTVYAYGFRKTRVMNFFLSHFVRYIYKNCDTIFVTCSGFSKRIQEYVPGKKITTAPNWPITSRVDIPEELEKIELPDGFNFTFTGNVGKVQNLENVILGFERFYRLHTGVYLNIVGDGSNLDDLKQLVSENNIEGVKFWGRYPVYTMPDFYAQSDVLILSLNESPIYRSTIPLKFQTYLTAGKPIFGIINGDVASLIEDNGIGYVANPGNIKNIADAFRYFLSQDERVKYSIRIKSHKLLQKQFNRKKIIKNISGRVGLQ